MTVSLASVALLCVAVLLARPLQAANADITLVDGVYQGLVLGIHPDTQQPEDGDTFLQEIKTFLESGSAALWSALGEGAAFGDVKLVLPRSWDKTKFSAVQAPVEELTIASADILLHDTADSLPSTLQAEQCGVPGRQMLFPLSFLSLNTDEELLYGTTGHILAHEWAQYRYGVHDENGYTNDPVYPPAYGGDEYLISGCIAGEMTGTWRQSCSGDGGLCRPNDDGCYYCIDEQASISSVQASLGYMPALSTGQFCTAETHNKHSPTPQNTLCGRRSVMEVIQAHPDYENMMTGITVSDINIAVHEEPLGRVMFLLDTPSDSGDVLSYEQLLDNVRDAVTQHSNLQVSMLSFKSLDQDDVELVNHRPFATIDEGEYNSLKLFLPSTESRTAVPDLALVLAKVLELPDFSSEYEPGTLLVIPANDQLMTAAKLDMEHGITLRQHRIKPLFLYPEVSPSLASTSSFLQHSGARFIAKNDTDGPVDFASVAAREEVYAFVDHTFQRDHAIAKVETAQLTGGSSYTSKFWYQGDIAQHKMALLTTTGDISQLQLKYYNFGSYRDCESRCTSADGSIFYIESQARAFASPGQGWHLEVENMGSETVEITLTRSIVNFVYQTEEEVSVDVWSSDSRGPVAAISNNNLFAIYASVSNRGKQILGAYVNVLADVDITRPGQSVENMLGLPLLDDGTTADIRKDDSVFSGYVSDVPLEMGTFVTITNVYVESHTIIGELTPTVASHKKRQVMSSSSASARLFARDPVEQECCASFVQSPDTEFDLIAKGIFLHLPEPIKPIEVTRVPTDGTTTTSTTTTTTTTTTAAPTTAAPTTTTEGLTHTTPVPPTTTVPLGSTTVGAVVTTTTTAAPAVTTTTQAPTTTAGVACIELTLRVLLHSALAVYLATLMH